MENAEQLVVIDKSRRAPVDVSTGAINFDPPVVDVWTSVRGYWTVLRRQRWTIFTVWLLCISLTALASFYTKPVYEATARVEVGGESSQIQSNREMYLVPPGDEPFLLTQVKILESDNLSGQAISQLNLQKKPSFAVSGRSGESLSEPTIEALLVQKLHQEVSVHLLPDTRMVEVSVDDHDPELAAAIANALIDNYVEFNFRKRLDSTKQSSQWIDQQINDLRDKVQQSQRALVEYDAKNAIVNVGDHQNTAEARLAELTKNHTDAQNERIAKQSFSDLVRGIDVSFLAPTEVMQHLLEKDAEVKEEYVDALAQYGPAFPKVKRLKGQLDNYEKLVDAERERIARRVKGDFLAADAKEKQLAAAVADQEKQVADVNSRMVQGNILRGEFETNQHLYESLLQHQKDAAVSEGLRAANTHIVDRATAPLGPIRPRVVFNLGIGFVVGLVAGMCLALLRGGIANSVEDLDQLEQLLVMPALGLIPWDYKEISGFRVRSRHGAVGDSELVLLKRPGSLQADAYRNLRNSILRVQHFAHSKVLLVTSPYPREGKTCTSVNLAVSLAQHGHKVLLIDADCRTHAIGEQIATGLGIQPKAGLTDVLREMELLGQSICECLEVPHLFVLPAGQQASNATDLLSSAEMERLLGRLRRSFEYIIVDSPPVLGLSESSSLSTFVDGVMLVVESGVTSREAIMRACKIIRSVGGNLIGAVLNKVDIRDSMLYRKTQRYYLAS